MNHPKRILICPLNWGLGHATRCIPIIRLLIQKKQTVVIAAEGGPLELLKIEFPELEFITFKGVRIKYPTSGSMIIKMLFSITKITKGIKAENKLLGELIKKHKIDIVISDNRYGCWSEKVKSIFITHQLMIKSPLAENFIHKQLSKYINKYEECWIPDFENENNLSGDLSHKYTLSENTFFIGPLSRFRGNTNDLKAESINEQNELVAIISGPEPQRSIFENIIREQIIKSNQKALIVLGLPNKELKIEHIRNVKFVSHLDSTQMKSAVENATIIIARSGYSTIMDIAALNKKAIFIPTPGQTEQEYLAKLLMQKKIAFYQTQSKFKLTEALKESNNYSGFSEMKIDNTLETRIDSILSSK